MKKQIALTLPMTLILAIAFITIVSLNLLNYSVYLNLLIYPVTFLLTNIVNKLCGYKIALKCFFCSFGILLLTFLIDFFCFKHLTNSFIIAEILAISIPQIINIFFYKYLVDKNKCSFLNVFISMILINIVDNLVFTGLMSLMVGYETELMAIITSTAVRCVYCLLLAFIDTKIPQKS